MQDVHGPEFIRICPGTYNGAFTIPRAVRLYGGGDGTGAAATILDGSGTGGPVITIEPDRTVTLERLRITGGSTTVRNGANTVGGGIYSQAARLTITDCTIFNNTGADGGGLYQIGASDTPPFTIEMTGCTVTNNTASNPSGQGGGIFAAGGELLLRQCDVSDNLAGFAGGGIYSWDPFTAQDTRVSGNHATLGGGIFARISATLDGSQVTGNTAGGGQSGGGIFNSNSHGVIHLLNGSTVSGNTPDDCVHPDGSPACATG